MWSVKYYKSILLPELILSFLLIKLLRHCSNFGVTSCHQGFLLNPVLPAVGIFRIIAKYLNNK